MRFHGKALWHGQGESHILALIRTWRDQGIVVVLDNRILTKNYGQTFLNAIPKCPVEVV